MRTSTVRHTRTKIKAEEVEGIQTIVEEVPISDPPANCKKVVNIYVELVNGQPKLRVEYEA